MEEFAHLRSAQKGAKTETEEYSYLNETCRDAGAGRDDGLETAVVHHEVANCNKKQMKWRSPPCNLIVIPGRDGNWHLSLFIYVKQRNRHSCLPERRNCVG